MAGSSVARSSLYATMISPPFCGVEFDDAACVDGGAAAGAPQAVSVIARARSAYKSLFRFMIFFSFGKTEHTKPQLKRDIAVNAKLCKAPVNDEVVLVKRSGCIAQD